MRPITRNEILDLGAYDAIRPRFLARIIEMKKHRRLSVGDHMTFIFENRDTVLFQIQEMLRTERITQEKAIAHEIETYNSMVPGDGELFATLMIEYDDKAERTKALTELAGLKRHVHFILGNARTTAEFEALPGEEDDRLPTVNYVRFRVGGGAANALRDTNVRAAMSIDIPAYRTEADVPPEMRVRLADDLDEP